MSRDVKLLLPSTQAKWNAFVSAFNTTYKADGAIVYASSTYRDDKEQNELYAKGRTTMGNPCSCVKKKIKCTHPFGLPVTNAKGGESEHQYKIAIDMGITIKGASEWGNAWFTKAGVLAEKYGFRWSGRWIKFPELAHIADDDFVMDIHKKVVTKAIKK